MSLPSTQRILLVEDEPGLREVLTLALEGAGFLCEAVAGIEEGQQALREAPFDGVLSDLKLKDGSGIELLTWMKEQGLETPVVIMTAYATTETTVQALNQGAVDFITKPFKHEDLIASLKGLLAASLPEAPPPTDLGELVGVGPLMRKINALIGKVSRADTTVLLMGESGIPAGTEVTCQTLAANQDNLKTRRYLEGVIQGVGEAIISFSADGKILTWNTAAETMFGYARTEIVGHTMQTLTPKSLAGELAQAVNQVSQGQTLRDVQSTRIKKGGAEFPVRITYAPVRGADDRVLAFSALVRDLGEQKDLEQKLVDSQNQPNYSRILPPMLSALSARINPISAQVRLIQENSGVRR